MASLWGAVADTLKASSTDVIVDLGRGDVAAATTALVTSCDVVMIVCEPTLSSVMHTRALISELLSLPGIARARVVPLLVGPPRHAEADARDLDEVFISAGLPVEPSAVLARDPQALALLEAGHGSWTKAFRRTAMARSSTALAARLVPSSAVEEVGA